MAGKSKARIIIGELAPNLMVFNDRMKDGRRSIKVWGWHKHHYDYAVEVLNKSGLTAELVEFEAYSLRAGQHYIQRRIHVTPD